MSEPHGNDHLKLRGYYITPPRHLRLDKDFVRALLYSHLPNIGWGSIPEIESVEMDGDDVVFHFKSQEETNTLCQRVKK